MKRGFLLRAEERKATALRRDAQVQSQSASVPSSTAAVDPQATQHPKGNVASGNPTPGNNGLLAFPNFSNLKGPMMVFKESDPEVSKAAKDLGRLTSIPHIVPDDEIQCQWLVCLSTKAKVLNSPGYPARIPKPSHPDLYQVRSTSVMGKGLFAKCHIKRGDLIFAERPLLVTPNKLVMMLPDPISDPQQKMRMTLLQIERMLELAIGRLPPESQVDYKALQNVRTDEGFGPLYGIMMTNSYSINKLYDDSDEDKIYGAVCKIGSRINHSCISNVKQSFRFNSFSMQFYAIRDIKAGEQLFYSYCAADNSLAARRTELAPYSFACKCPACVNATPETDKLRTTFNAQIQAFRNAVLNSQISQTMLKKALKLEKAMIKEGLDTELSFVLLLEVISVAYEKLGKVKEGANYRLLREELGKCLEDEA